MAYASDALNETATPRWFKGGGEGSNGSHQSPPGRPPRDLKKLFLVFGLGVLSWVATYVGMLELIEANMGDLPVVHKLIIAFSVAMLMTMIIWLLDQMFAPIGTFTRVAYVFGYMFLTLISVGFSFGFYWKVLESRSESSRSAESAVAQVQGSLNAASTRLEQLNATLLQLSAVSLQKAEQERAKGTSCPNSKPGDGPRRKMREDDASRFTFASDFVKGRVASVKGDMSVLDGDLAKIAAKDASMIDLKSGTRNEFMKALSRKLDMTVTGFNAFRTDPQLKQLRTDLAERGEKVTFGDVKSGGFVCPDAQLQQALRGAVRAIDQLPQLEKPQIAAVEGSEATIEAFRRLTTTLYGLASFKMPPSADELRNLQQKAVQSVEGGAAAQRALAQEAAGLSKRDYVPLAIALFVDICLLLVSIGRPVNRLHGLVPKMREAEIGPVSEILSRFKDIHRDPQVRESFELFRHVVFDLNGDYYVAVPLDAPLRMNPMQREELRGEAQLLSNLFASFEREKIFTRTWLPLTGRIKSKLRRQGSKFAESEAFRVYRFRKGAWSEIILGAVMGAAKRAEESGNLRDAGNVSARPSVSLARDGGTPRRHDHYNDAQSQSRSEPAWSARSQTASPKTVPQPRPDVAAAYGRYAQYDPPHPRTQAVMDGSPSTLYPANGNTAPSALRAQDTAALRVQETAALRAASGDGRGASKAFVAFGGNDAAPRRSQSEGYVTAAGSLQPESMSEMTSRADDTIVVLRRETATVSFPGGEAGSASDIIHRLGQALAVEPRSEDVIDRGVAVPAIAAQVPSVSQQITFLYDEVSDADVADLDSDVATADAIAMAGRLRPMQAGE